jgi:hypothetical protein
VNGLEAVAVIIVVFFIAGVMVGFLIVMALPAVAHRRNSRRSTRREGDREGPGQPGWREPPRWSRTGPPGEGDVGTAVDLPGDDGGPPGHPWRPGA